MIDAAGAIYVIGGLSYANTYFQDVWVSTDGGARPDSVEGVLVGYSGGTTRGGCYSRGSLGIPEGVHGGCTGVL